MDIREKVDFGFPVWTYLSVEEVDVYYFYPFSVFFNDVYDFLLDFYMLHVHSCGVRLL